MTEHYKEQLENMAREIPIRAIVDELASISRMLGDKNGHDESMQTYYDDAAFLAHAARHIKG